MLVNHETVQSKTDLLKELSSKSSSRQNMKLYHTNLGGRRYGDRRCEGKYGSNLEEYYHYCTNQSNRRGWAGFGPTLVLDRQFWADLPMERALVGV